VRSIFAFRLAQAIAVLSLGIATPARAATQTFNTASSSARYAVNDGGFWVTSAPISGSSTSPGLNATSTTAEGAFHLTAGGASYSDAGIVLYLDGGLKLGDLQGVSIASTGSPVSMNLWLDSGGDGKFFAFDPNGLLTGLNGDSYGGGAGNAQGATSPFYMLGGDGAGGTYTLGQLQAGAVSGIGAGTAVALWIGIANAGGSTLSADIGAVTVTTAAGAPVPALPWPMTGLVGVLLALLAVTDPRRRPRTCCRSGSSS
jgi:hypothetical protein